MSNSFIKPVSKVFLIAALVGFNHIALADWKQDCAQLTAPNLQNPCDPIQHESDSLSAFMPPAPFLAPTPGDFSKVDAGSSPFPNGSPFGAAPAAAATGGTSDVLPPADSSTGGASSSSGTTGGATSGSGSWQ